MRLHATFLAVVTTAALASPAPAADAPTPKGVETGDLDRSVEPCTDFFEFANGTWRAQNPIPPSMVRWSRRWAAGESAKEQLKTILDEVSAKPDWPKGSVEQLIGDHYAACMDEAKVDALGLEPLKPLLAEIDAVTSMDGVQTDDRPLPRDRDPGPLRPLRRLRQPRADAGHRRRVRLGPRPARPRLLREDGAALPGGAREVRGPRRAHARAGRGEPGRLAEGRATPSSPSRSSSPRPRSTTWRCATRRPPTTRRRSSPSRSSRRMFDWPAYFAEAKLPRAALNVQQPKFMKALDRLLGQGTLADWKTYLRWHLRALGGAVAVEAVRRGELRLLRASTSAGRRR